MISVVALSGRDALSSAVKFPVCSCSALQTAVLYQNSSDCVSNCRMADYSLFELEKDYYLGNYQSCINKANSMLGVKESTFYMCLSYFHLKKYDILRHEIEKSDDPSIKLIGLLVAYTIEPDKRDEVLQILEQQSVDKSIHANLLARLVTSSIYSLAKKYPEALRELYQLESTCVYLAQIGIYLAMNRVDLAQRQLKVMQNKDDYSTLTLLATAHVKLASNQAKEAYDIGKELEDVYKATPLIKNIQTAAAICLGRFDEAKQHCENSLDLDNDNPEALINMLHILAKLKGSIEIKERHYARLKTLFPNHNFVHEIESIDSLRFETN